MKHGIVTSTKVGSEGHVLLTVQSSRAGVTWQNVVASNRHPGDSQSIEEGWHVALDECDDGLLVFVGVLNTDPDLAEPSLNASERVMRFDNGTEISAKKNDAGNYDVTISASGDVTIGDSANAVQLAVQEHTHDVTLSDSSTSTSFKPNESGTETTVE